MSKSIKISSRVYVSVPTGYKRSSLPFFAEWVKALESGNYRRVDGTLYADKKYCCLGVLCKVQGVLEDGKDTSGCDEEFVGESTMLSTRNASYAVLEDIGRLPHNCFVIIDKHTTLRTLADINDSNLVGFKTIAKIIKAIWKA